MSPRGTRRRLVRPARMRWAVVLRIVALCAAWQGPLPWCHRHDGAAVAETDSTWLADHLQAYHRTTVRSANRPSTPLGWHWHVELPGSLTDAGHALCRARLDAVVPALSDENAWSPANDGEVAGGTLATPLVSPDGRDFGKFGSSSFCTARGPERPQFARSNVLRI